MSFTAIVTTYTAKPQAAAQFEEGFAIAAANISETESGCHIYQLARGSTRGQYVSIELYRNRSALLQRSLRQLLGGDGWMFGLLESEPAVQLLETLAHPGHRPAVLPSRLVITAIPIKRELATDYECHIAPRILQVQAERCADCALFCVGKIAATATSPVGSVAVAVVGGVTMYTVAELYSEKAAITEHDQSQNFREAQLEQAGFVADCPTRAVFTMGTAGDVYALATAAAKL